MLKFFRKNEKITRWILVVGMTFLMVSWLVFDQSSTFLTQLLEGRSTWATTRDGTSFSESDLRRLQQETRVIGMLGDPIVRQLQFDKDPVYWCLLSKEAEAAGLVGGAADGQSRITQMATSSNLPEANLLGALCREGGMSPREVFETIAKLNGVERYINLVLSGPTRMSVVRIEQTAASLLNAVSGEVTVLDGVNAKVDVPAPSDAELAEQLKEYGDQAPGSGKYGFGYKTADRVRLEWLVVPTTYVTAAVESSPALSNIELRKYWIENQAEFAAPQIAATAQGASFESNRDAVRAKVLIKASADKRAEIAKFISDRLQLSMRGIEQVNGYYTLPADWNAKQLSFSALATEVAQKFGTPQPAVESRTEEWIGVSDVASLPVLGGATTNRFGSQPVAAMQIIQSLREFGGKPTLVAQVAVAGPVLQTALGDIVAFRVTAAEVAAAPASVDAVREALTKDVTRVERFEKLEAMIADIQKQAADQGLSSVAQAYGTKVEPFTDLRQGEKQFLQYGLKFPGSLPTLGSDAAVAKAIVLKAMALPAGRNIADLPAADRTVVVAAPDKLAIVAARIDSVTPMHRGDLAPLLTNDRFKNVAASEMSDGSPLDLFTLEAITERQGFTLANPRSEADSADAASADGSKPDGTKEPSNSNDAKDATTPSESKASKS